MPVNFVAIFIALFVATVLLMDKATEINSPKRKKPRYCPDFFFFYYSYSSSLSIHLPFQTSSSINAMFFEKIIIVEIFIFKRRFFQKKSRHVLISVTRQSKGKSLGFDDSYSLPPK